MPNNEIRQWRVEDGLIEPSGFHGLLKGIIDFEYQIFGVVFTVLSDVLVFDYREGLQDVVVIALVDTIEVEKEGVNFASDHESTFFIPDEEFR